MLRPGKGGGRERLLWALAKVEARFGDARIDKVSERDVELWLAGLPTPSTRREVSRVYRQLFAQAGRHYGVKNPVRSNSTTGTLFRRTRSAVGRSSMRSGRDLDASWTQPPKPTTELRRLATALSL